MLMLSGSSNDLSVLLLVFSHFVIDIVTLLLEHGAPVKVKNALGWSAMSEAVSYGDRQISMYSLMPTCMFLHTCVFLYVICYML